MVVVVRFEAVTNPYIIMLDIQCDVGEREYESHPDPGLTNRCHMQR